MPDFVMVHLVSPEGFDPKKYEERYVSKGGYVTAFVGKLGGEKGSISLQPAYDVFLPGYW